MIIELKTAPEVLRAIRAADSTYRKRNAFLKVGPRVMLDGTYWSGGSRTTYDAVCLVTGKSVEMQRLNPPQFGGPAEAPTVEIPDGVAIIATGVFCGKPATAFVYVNANTAAPLITT